MVQVVKTLFDITHVTFIVEKLKKYILLDLLIQKELSGELPAGNLHLESVFQGPADTY